MTYNEPVMLPLWARYYAEQIGPRHCFVFDHGSDDGSVDRIDKAINVIRLPRSAHDDVEKVNLISDFAAKLLKDYERVLFTDTDELVVADPGAFSGLLDYCRRRHADTITLFGINIVHRFGIEPSLDPDLPILGQRSWGQACGFLCKPTLIHRKTEWCAGFHLADYPSIFDDIYLFHLAYMDRDVIYERQKKRNASAPLNYPNGHHAYSPDFVLRWYVEHFLSKPALVGAGFAVGCPERDAFEANLFGDPQARWKNRIDNLNTFSSLWRIPERFSEIF